jgi:hypothetical protein
LSRSLHFVWQLPASLKGQNSRDNLAVAAGVGPAAEE